MNFPPISILNLAPMPAEGGLTAAFSNMIQVAQAAEEFGYRRFWIAEHHNIHGVASSATDVLIGHVASQTKKIRVGSGGVMLPNHAPLIVAETFGTLATLYPGRIDLGLGRAPGTDPWTMRALRRDLRTTGEEFPDLVEELQYFLAPAEPDQKIQAVPGAGIDIPIWILGSSLFSADFAARKGLPYAFAAHFAPAHLIQAMEIYRDRFVPSSSLKEPYAIVCVPVVAANSNEEAWYLATSVQRKILGLVTGNYPKTSPPPVENMNDLWNPSQKAAVDSFLREMIIGDHEAIKSQTAKLLERTQANEVMAHSDLYRLEDTINSYKIFSEALS